MTNELTTNTECGGCGVRAYGAAVVLTCGRKACPGVRPEYLSRTRDPGPNVIPHLELPPHEPLLGALTNREMQTQMGLYTLLAADHCEGKHTAPVEGCPECIADGITRQHEKRT